MKIDSFDGSLVCENEDLQTVLSYFKENRKIPEYIEISILKIITKVLCTKEISHNSVDDYLLSLPNGFIKQTANEINLMFSRDIKVKTYKHKHLPYLFYYLPANVYKVWKPLLDLQLKNALKPNMHILDIGTGPGSVPIGIIEFYKSLALCFSNLQFSLSFSLIDSEIEFLNIAVKLIDMIQQYMPSNLTVKVDQSICKRISTDKIDSIEHYDLITMSNFLTPNESGNQQVALDIIGNFKNNLLDDGSFIIIDPGERNSCIALKRIRNEVINRKILNIFSPCIGIWEEKMTYNCECFNMVRCYWQIPRIYEYLIKNGLSKAKRIDVPFNYVIFRKDNLKKYLIEKNGQYFTKLVNLKDNINKTINVKALIRTVICQGDNINLSLCDGSCSFSDDRRAVWVNTSINQLSKHGIFIPLISAERITLKKVTVKLQGDQINLGINENSKIVIDY